MNDVHTTAAKNGEDDVPHVMLYRKVVNSSTQEIRTAWALKVLNRWGGTKAVEVFCASVLLWNFNKRQLQDKHPIPQGFNSTLQGDSEKQDNWYPGKDYGRTWDRRDSDTWTSCEQFF